MATLQISANCAFVHILTLNVLTRTNVLVLLCTFFYASYVASDAQMLRLSYMLYEEKGQTVHYLSMCKICEYVRKVPRKGCVKCGYDDHGCERMFIGVP